MSQAPYRLRYSARLTAFNSSPFKPSFFKFYPKSFLCKFPITSTKDLVGWLFDFNGHSRQCSVYIGPSPREREKEGKMIDERKKCPNNPNLHLVQAQ